MPRRDTPQDDRPRPQTIRDVAAHAGGSVATVSRVLPGTYCLCLMGGSRA
jgi:LacI family transcriptional regulator